MKESKDEQLTYEELTALCRKQEEYIKELEEKLKTPSETIKCDVPKPDYDELIRERDNLNHQLNVLINENNALRWSLTMAYKEMTAWENAVDMWKEDYYKEHNRAEKLYDEWKKLKND